MKYPHTAGAVVILAIALIVMQEARSFGFPDGALTELERAERPLFYAFAAASIVCAGALVLLPMHARRWGWAAYVVIAIVVVILDRQFATNLAGGGGG